MGINICSGHAWLAGELRSYLPIGHIWPFGKRAVPAVARRASGDGLQCSTVICSTLLSDEVGILVQVVLPLSVKATCDQLVIRNHYLCAVHSCTTPAFWQFSIRNRMIAVVIIE